LCNECGDDLDFGDGMMKRQQAVTWFFGALALATALATSPHNLMGTTSAYAQQAQALPNVADLADRLLPAVVEISVESKVAGGPASVPEVPQLPEDSPFKDFFDDFFKKRQGEGGQPGGRTVSSMGSGFIVDAQGLVVTNNHVVEGAESIQIHMQDGTILKAELVGRDAKTDLAVIRVKSEKPLPTVSFGDSDTLRIGEWVMAIGNPFGLGGSVSLGIVSARNRDISAGPYDDFIQTDAAINKGNSGGPLFNLDGQVMGINTAIFSPTGGSVGIGFSVPANTAKGVIDQLIKYGETRRGWLGVRVQSMSDEIVESMGLPKNAGALVADVTEGSPGKTAGIEAGDVITSFNGKPIKDMKELPRAVAAQGIGATVEVIRKGKPMSFNVTIGRLEDGEKLVAADDKKKESAAATTVTTLGMTAATLTDELRTRYKVEEKVKGAVITEVAKEGAAFEKGLEVGDVIMEAGGKPVEVAADISKAIEDAEKGGKNSVLLLTAKAGKASETRFIALKIKK
jgi:serine protease Do